MLLTVSVLPQAGYNIHVVFLKMHFLKIDKNNIFLNKKTIAIIAISLFFTLGFSNNVFATDSNGLPSGVALRGTQNILGLDKPTYWNIVDSTGATVPAAQGTDGKYYTYSSSYLSGFNPNRYFDILSGKSQYNTSMSTYTEVTPKTDATGKIEIAQKNADGSPMYVSPSEIPSLNPDVSPPITYTNNGTTYTYLGNLTGTNGKATSNEIWSDSNGKQYAWNENSGQPFSLQPMTNKAPSITDTVTGNNAVQTGTGYTTDPGASVEKDTSNGQCIEGGNVVTWKLHPKNCLIIGLYYTIFWPISWLVGVAGWLFNFVFTKTVVEMSSGINQIGAIDIAWKTMRDLSNIGFIFILLWLAISTILGAGEHDVKKTLSKLVIVAILINFSLFFTKIIIDASNILAIAFFNAIVVGGGGTTGTGATGLGDAFMGAFRLQSLFDITKTATNGQGVAANGNSASLLIGGSITMLVAMIVLLASLMMFIKRYITLILVMIFSPLAFAGMILHQTEHSVHEWWNYLLKEAFFAPMYMILLWISFTVINDTGFLAAIGNPSKDTSMSSAITAGDTGTSGTGTEKTGPASVLLDFMIVSALLISSLIVAEKMGVVGASGAMNFAKGAQGMIQGGITGGAMGAGGWAMANTIGRFGQTIGNKGASSAFLQNARAGKLGSNAFSKFAYRKIGQAGLGMASGLSSAKFGGQMSMDEKLKGREQEFKDYLEEHHYSQDAYAHVMSMGAGSIYGTDKKAVHNIIHGMSPEQIADSRLAAKGNATVLRMLSSDHDEGRLTKDMEKKVEVAEKAGRPGHIDEITALASSPAELKTRWAGMTAGQRKYIMENMSATEAGIMSSHLDSMIETMKETDTAAVESLIKSGKTSDLVKRGANNIVANSAMRTNLYNAWDKATNTADKALYAKEFGNMFKDVNGNSLVISTNKPSASDDSIAELYNKNLNRYVTLSDAEKTLVSNMKGIDKTISEANDAKAEAKAAAAQAKAVTGMATEVLATARKMI
ncbi:MAG: hypothetical protein WCF92_01635 [bacterium]